MLWRSIAPSHRESDELHYGIKKYTTNEVNSVKYGDHGWPLLKSVSALHHLAAVGETHDTRFGLPFSIYPKILYVDGYHRIQWNISIRY